MVGLTDARRSLGRGVLGLSAHQDLTADVAEAAMAAILDGGASPAQIAGFIVALRMKGETVEELSGCCARCWPPRNGWSSVRTA